MLPQNCTDAYRCHMLQDLGPCTAIFAMAKLLQDGPLDLLLHQICGLLKALATLIHTFGIELSFSGKTWDVCPGLGAPLKQAIPAMAPTVQVS